MADTNHSDIEMLRTFRDTVRNFARDGGRHIVMESDPVYSQIFNAIREGRATLDNFADVMDVSAYIPAAQRQEAQALFRDIMQIALDHNMQFHAVDQPPTEAMQRYPDIHQAIIDANTGNPESFNNRLRDDPEFRRRFEDYNRLFQAQRIANDTNVANTVRDLTANGDRALVMYGADHIPRLASQLGYQNVQGYYIINPNTPVGAHWDERLRSWPLHQERRGDLSGRTYADMGNPGSALPWSTALQGAHYDALTGTRAEPHQAQQRFAELSAPVADGTRLAHSREPSRTLAHPVA